MSQPARLRPGDEIHCRRCGHWHRLEPGDPEQPAGVKMLFVKCRLRFYFAGLIDAIATQPVRTKEPV